MEKLLRNIPQVSRIIESFKGRYPEELVKRAAREITELYRDEILEGRRSSVEGIYRDVERRIKELLSPSLRRVVNATGVVINTNLGRAPLSDEVAEFVENIAKGYSNLEYDLCAGRRGSRNSHLEGYLKDLTGAEAGLVVNNNASAVFLILNTLASGREVVVSRGELVEIGGSFRIPDIMRSSGAILKEVGTTNRTRLRDYEEAISEETALLMKVHRSNFYMEGFTEEVALEGLVELGRRYGLPTYYDAGSGLILEPKELKTEWREPSFSQVLSAGVDLVSGSGDKLLGGPQAGIILGRRELIDAMKRNPLLRVVRIDKLTLAGLEATLRLYIEGRVRDIPVIRMLSEGEEALRKRADRLRRLLRDLKGFKFRVVKDRAKPGGGTLPKLELPTYCLSVSHPQMSAQELARKLRNSQPPVVGRIREGRFLLDMRTVSDSELRLIKEAFKSIL